MNNIIKKETATRTQFMITQLIDLEREMFESELAGVEDNQEISSQDIERAKKGFNIAAELVKNTSDKEALEIAVIVLLSAPLDILKDLMNSVTQDLRYVVEESYVKELLSSTALELTELTQEEQDLVAQNLEFMNALDENNLSHALHIISSMTYDILTDRATEKLADLLDAFNDENSLIS